MPAPSARPCCARRRPGAYSVRCTYVCTRRRLVPCVETVPPLAESNHLGPHSTSKEVPMPEIQWLHDPDAGLKQAAAEHKMVLLDFTAAPM